MAPENVLFAQPTGSSSRRGAKSLEERTRDRCQTIFDAVTSRRPWPLSPSWWKDQMLHWSIADEQVKTRLFRCVDALPMLADDDDVIEHMHCYFRGEGTPWPLRALTRIARKKTWTGRFIARAVRSQVAHLASGLIAGSNAGELIPAIENLRERGMNFTVDVLGEATVSEREADDYLNEYLELLDRIPDRVGLWTFDAKLDMADHGQQPRTNLSIKVSALNSLFDPIDQVGSCEVVKNRLREILRTAMAKDAFIHFDMEQYEYKDLTLKVFQQILEEPEFRDWDHVGIAMQAYLLDTRSDLQKLCSWVQRRGTPITVRLVKGAYWDSEVILAKQRGWPVPVFTQKWRTDANYEDCTEFILEHRKWLRPAIAGHNVRSLSRAAVVAEQLGLAPGAYELQMLFGMADPIKEALVGQGERVRIYTPFGQLIPGMAYLVRRLLENSSNTSFLRATFLDRSSIEQLIAPPRMPLTASR